MSHSSFWASDFKKHLEPCQIQREKITDCDITWENIMEWTNEEVKQNGENTLSVFWKYEHMPEH